MANIKISELNPLLTVQDADVLPIVDNGVTKKVTAAILRSYTQGNSVLLTGAQTVAGIKTFTSQLASSVATGTAPFSVASTTKVTNLNADLLDGLSSADFQATLSGTGIVKSTAGTISYLTDNTANWDTAYNDKINSATVTGSGTNTLTLTQQDAGTITATWVNGTLIREVRNTTGATLTKGTIVYISGATGNKPTVTKAIASGDSTSAQTFGFIQSDLANNANGYVVVVGDLTGVDTSAFAEGDQLYLSSTVAGAFTSTKQYAPAHLVYVGIVTRSHPTLGQIEVNIQNGYELDELHNVSAQSPSNGDILQYVTSTGLWTKIAGTTTNISEGTNLYFTNARSRSAISESVTGLDYNSTTGVLSTTSGYGIPTTASQATWDTAYNDSIVSAAVTGTTTKTLTLNQQDGGTVTASWTDINTDAVSSVFGRTGAVVAASGDYTTTQVTEGTNLYFTDARARAAISLTTTGTSGAATYSGGVLNIPQYQAALTNPITGTGTTNYLPKFTGTSALGNSIISDSGSVISVAGSINMNTYGKITSITPYLELRDTNWSASTFVQTGVNVGATSSGDYFSIYNPAGKGLSYVRGGVVDFMISSAGNVGIGTTSPAAKLDVDSTGYSIFANNSSGNRIVKIGTQSASGEPAIQATLSNGTARYLLLNPDGGDVGINTTSPINTSGYGGLSLNGTNGAIISLLQGGSETFRVTNATGYSFINTTGETPLLIGTYSAERMRITSSGNIGIGTTSPAAKLTVVGATTIIGQTNVSARFSDDDNSTLLISHPLANGNTAIITGNNQLGFATGVLGSIAERMRITSAGNVGIGTTSPNTKLQVLGTIAAQINADGSDATGIRIYGSGTSKRMDFVAADGSVNERISGIGTGGIGIMAFSVNNNVGVLTERMRIAESGNFLVGTTTDAGYKLDVNGTARVQSELRIQKNGSALTLSSNDVSGNFIGFSTISSNTGYIGNAYHLFGSPYNNNTDLGIRAENNLILSSGAGTNFLTLSSTTATFSGQVNIGNPVAAAVAVASTHKVTIVIGGTTYYLLATT